MTASNAITGPVATLRAIAARTSERTTANDRAAHFTPALDALTGHGDWFNFWESRTVKGGLMLISKQEILDKLGADYQSVCNELEAAVKARYTKDGALLPGIESLDVAPFAFEQSRLAITFTLAPT